MEEKIEVLTDGTITGIGTFFLSKPIDVNGKKISEIKYDLDSLTAKDKQTATNEYKKAGNISMLEDVDSEYHVYLFAAAAYKENDSIDINDILRMSAKDAIKAGKIVRNFFFFDSEDI